MPDVAGSFAGSSGGMTPGPRWTWSSLPRHTEAYIAQAATVDVKGTSRSSPRTPN